MSLERVCLRQLDHSETHSSNLRELMARDRRTHSHTATTLNQSHTQLHHRPSNAPTLVEPQTLNHRPSNALVETTISPLLACWFSEECGLEQLIMNTGTRFLPWIEPPRISRASSFASELPLGIMPGCSLCMLIEASKLKKH